MPLTSPSPQDTTISYACSLPCSPEISESLSDWLTTLPTVVSVMLLYQDDENGVEKPYQVKVFSHEPTIDQQVKQAITNEPHWVEHQILADTVSDTIAIAQEDWAESWKQFWHVEQLIPNALTICPSWETYEPTHPDEVVLNLDPGSAFGTGAHETTRLMLRGLHQEAKQGLGVEGKTVLDMGCGSGILAIYAHKLGAKKAIGLDIDPVAVTVSVENAGLNQCNPETLVFSDAPLLPFPMVEADLILANILGPVIIELLPAFCANLKPNGVLWCSGLIDSSCKAVMAAMADAGLTQLETIQENRWFAIRGVYETNGQ
ncbi:MAG: 50S ribosomal protein L11 methyltransferase [Vampirovibrio sp.]|nr:50S ribosomal protein L11 methyltransferase [Vampirovibrio sp.]